MSGLANFQQRVRTLREIGKTTFYFGGRWVLDCLSHREKILTEAGRFHRDAAEGNLVARLVRCLV